MDIFVKKHGVNVAVYESNWTAAFSGHLDDVTQQYVVAV